MRLLLAGALATITVACTGSHGMSSLSAPSATTPTTTSPAPTSSKTGASIEGSVTVGAVSASQSFHALAGGLSVSVVGTTIASEVDGSGQFKLNDVPSGDVEVAFSGSGVDARISVDAVGTEEHIEIAVVVSGSSVGRDEAAHRRGSNG